MSLLIWFLLLGGAELSLGGKTPTLLYFDFALVVWLVLQVIWRNFWPNFNGFVFHLGSFYFIGALFSALVNPQGAYRSIATIKVFLVGFLVYAIARRKPAHILMLSAWGAFVSVLLLVQYRSILLQNNFESTGAADPAQVNGVKNALTIVLGGSNYVASTLLLLIPIAFGGIALYKGRQRIASAIFAFVMLGGLIATMSRGAMAALTLSIVFCIPLLRKIGLGWKHLTVVVAIVVLVFLLLPVDLIQQDIDLITYRLDNPDLNRQELMLAAWKAFADNPLLGVGPGQIGSALAHRITVSSDDVQYMHAHNIVLDALAENGFLTGLGLLAIFALLLRSAWKAAKSRPNPLSVALFAAILAVLLHQMVESSFPGEQFQVIFWTVAALIEGQNHVIGQVSPSMLPHGRNTRVSRQFA